MFDFVVRAIHEHKSLQLQERTQVERMLEECDSCDLRNHPETLLYCMYCYLGDTATWKILTDIVRKTRNDFSIHEVQFNGLDELEKYKRCNNREIQGAILDALADLREAELARVKLLLSSTIAEEYGHIATAHIYDSSPEHLADKIVSTYCTHAVYVMILVFTQIERMDLVEKLTCLA